MGASEPLARICFRHTRMATVAHLQQSREGRRGLLKRGSDGSKLSVPSETRAIGQPLRTS
jgi:hypothetical protein